MAPLDAPARPVIQSAWQDHQGCEWSWQIETDGPDTAVCVAHSAVFVLPTPAEAYTL